MGAPREIGQVIDKALEKLRDNRYATIDDLANAVRAACGEAPLTRGTTEVIRAANMAAPANLTTQRPAVTPPPSTSPPALGTAPPAVGTAPPSTSPPGMAAVGPTPTPAPGVKTQWTGQLVVPNDTTPAHAPHRSKAPVFIGAGIVVVGAAIAVALVMKGGGGGGSGNNGPGSSGSGTNVATPGSGSAATVAAVIDAGAAPEAPLPAEVIVTIESTPKGAQVFDFDNKALIGTTPVTFHVEPSHHLRHYTVKMGGYSEEVVELVPEKSPIDQQVTLKRGASVANIPNGNTNPPHVDAGVAVVPPPAPDAAVTVAVQPDAAVVVAVPAIDAAVHVTPPPDDCPDIP